MKPEYSKNYIKGNDTLSQQKTKSQSTTFQSSKGEALETLSITIKTDAGSNKAKYIILFRGTSKSSPLIFATKN